MRGLAMMPTGERLSHRKRQQAAAQAPRRDSCRYRVCIHFVPTGLRRTRNGLIPRGEEPEEATFHAGRMRLPEAAARALVSLTIHPQRMMLRERPIARLGPTSTSTPDVNRQELSRA